jgi:hypothetical protein
MTARQMRSPAPRWNAEDRAVIIRNETSDSIARTEPEADFATIYLARRFGLAVPLAPTIAALANPAIALG